MAEPLLCEITGTIYICEACLDGEGGECHTPGCMFWVRRAPDVPIRDFIDEICGARIQVLEDKAVD